MKVRIGGNTVGALVRRTLWRATLALTGGLTVKGSMPRGGCVVVANHSSHADTAALLAALPARSRPVVAAAADYWFARPARARFCRWLVGGVPVRRTGGGSADLAETIELLRNGRAVIVYPEGTRSHTGELGEFRTGAARLAARAGVPLVPVGLSGTRKILPVHGKPHVARAVVRIGKPVGETDARQAVFALATSSAPDRDSRLRRRLALLALSPGGLVLAMAWAMAEALFWPLLPGLLLAILCVAAPRAGFRLSVTAAAASVVGGMLSYVLAMHGLVAPHPLTTPRMHEAVARQTAQEGAAAVRQQPLSGIPYKVYAARAGKERVGLWDFARVSAVARGSRILTVGLLCTVLGAAVTRGRRFFPLYLCLLCAGFTAGLAATVAAWS